MVDREIEGIPAYLQIIHVESELKGDDMTALEILLKTDVERTRLLEEEKKIIEKKEDTNIDRLNEIYKRMDEIECHSAESKASSILFGLGFTKEMQKMKSKHFSGGWRMRLALARALYVDPEVLMLDEPTNHLDLHAVLWLENFLCNYTNTLVLVSHDRNFLNTVVTDIIHFNNLKLTHYKGDYEEFEIQRKEALILQEKTFKNQQSQKKHIQSFIDRFRYNASKAKMAQSRIKMLEKMEDSFVSEVISDPEFSFEFPSPEPEKSPYIQAVDLSFSYHTKEKDSKLEYIFEKMNFNLDSNSRIALVGKLIFHR
jgi:ATP-binding cassette, subfamily F, member 3